MEIQNDIAYFIKYHRDKSGMTQAELAKRAGVGLRFVRELEQGKGSLRIDKINQVLSLFGYKMFPGDNRIFDPYELQIKYVGKPVHILLKDRTELYGIILGPANEDKEVKTWQFVSNNDAIRYKNSEDPKLVREIQHALIENIEYQQE